MKAFAGILGIIGGLLGLPAFSGYLLDGYFLHGFFLGGSHAATGSDIVACVLGDISALICIAAGIAVLAGRGRRAGLCLLVAGLIAISIGTFIGAVAVVLMTPAVIGGVFAMTPRRLPTDELSQRPEW